VDKEQIQQIIAFIRGLYPGRDFIALHEPHFSGNEKKYTEVCIDSIFVSSVGKYVDRFEEMIREYTGAKCAIATVNGTAALHIALKLAGVEQGDLVITQALTFIATCNAISYCGAEPVFVDIGRDTLGMSPDFLENWLKANTVVVEGNCFYQPRQDAAAPDLETVQNLGLKRISACVPMHTFGHPCQIDKIVAICDRYYIPVVEDSAESIGSYYKDQHTGTFGKLGIFSFNGNKTITTGGGGMVVTDDDELGSLAKHITTTAKKPHPWRFEHDRIGYNYRLPNINAALGCAQMEKLPQILQNKRETAQAYQSFFADFAEIEFIDEPKDCVSNFWLNAILLKDVQAREAFLKETNESKVMTRPAWVLMNELQMYKDCITANLSVSQEISDRLVNIPSSVR
jgi:aminotransferase in exopolysaccharide biosynthesis